MSIMFWSVLHKPQSDEVLYNKFMEQLAGFSTGEYSRHNEMNKIKNHFSSQCKIIKVIVLTLQLFICLMWQAVLWFWWLLLFQVARGFSRELNYTPVKDDTGTVPVSGTRSTQTTGSGSRKKKKKKCKDTFTKRKCKYMYKMGMCKVHHLQNWMRSNCGKTCGFCLKRKLITWGFSVFLFRVMKQIFNRCYLSIIVICEPLNMFLSTFRP